MRVSNLQWRHIPDAHGFTTAVVAVIQPELFTGLLSGKWPGAVLQNEPVEGVIRSTGEELGAWSLTPTQCLDGREHGFHGIAFLFAAGDPV